MTREERQEQTDAVVARARRSLTLASIILCAELIALVVFVLTVVPVLAAIAAINLALTSIYLVDKNLDVRRAQREFPVRQFNGAMKQIPWSAERDWLSAHWKMASHQGLASDYKFPGPHPIHAARLAIGGSEQGTVLGCHRHAKYCRCRGCDLIRRLGLDYAMYNDLERKEKSR